MPAMREVEKPVSPSPSIVAGIRLRINDKRGNSSDETSVSNI
eukprot:CAMPEP_0185823822 /NCGR_PEP_ID=MMETSP1322-20130828/28737_1 /TAXON_ID=265543 /ORGANISM="Minutocellus polymorphus, Strain RCC2270" /LENGTH=41 /DNA_ID= /DNA_START= /DNA_END= /DNA_ORIENTATION=